MADDITQVPVTPAKFFDHFSFTWVIVGISTIIFIVSLFFMPHTGETAAPLQAVILKLQNKALVMILGVFYSLWWKGTNYNVDKIIWRDPIAVSIYIGCVFLALALA
jgi:hypothetical protein